jgi:hydroxyacylglutathione hydrolase
VTVPGLTGLGARAMFTIMSTDLVENLESERCGRGHSLDPTSVAAALSAGAVVVDGRSPGAFDAGHVAGAVNIPAGDDAGALAALLIGPDVPVLTFCEWAGQADVMAGQLGAAGFRCVLGSAAGERPGRALGPGRLRRSGAVDAGRLAAELATGAVLLVDVRDEWESHQGRLPGALYVPLPRLREAAPLLPAVPTVTACTDGRRAAAAASALRRLGHANVWRLAGAGVADLLERPIGLDLLGAA